MCEEVRVFSEKCLENNILPFFCHNFDRFTSNILACVAGVERGRGRKDLGACESMWGARGTKERDACKDAIVLSIFYAPILSVKIVIGQNFLNVNLLLTALFRLVEINITPFE